MIPLCDPTRDPYLPEIQAAVTRVISSGRYVLGLETLHLEMEFKHRTRTNHAIAVSSCTDALYIAYSFHRSLSLSIPALTFVATAESAIRAKHVGAVSFHDRGQYVGQKFRVDVSLFGVPCEPLPYAPPPYICDKAQCFPEPLTGALCDVYSFFPAKPLGCLGDGGMIVTNDERFAAVARRMRNHGSDNRVHHTTVGGNFRMSEVNSACINVKMQHLDYYRKRLENVSWLRSRVPIVGNTYANTIGRPVGDIETKQYYPLLVPEQLPYHRKGSWPISEWFSRNLWGVPCGPELSQSELGTIVTACEKGTTSNISPP